MSVREVIHWGDPRLKIKSADVGPWTPELEQLAQDLFDTALVEDGVGIAAPQIGINLNLAVIDCSCGREMTFDDISGIGVDRSCSLWSATLNGHDMKITTSI